MKSYSAAFIGIILEIIMIRNIFDKALALYWHCLIIWLKNIEYIINVAGIADIYFNFLKFTRVFRLCFFWVIADVIQIFDQKSLMKIYKLKNTLLIVTFCLLLFKQVLLLVFHDIFFFWAITLQSTLCTTLMSALFVV